MRVLELIYLWAQRRVVSRAASQVEPSRIGCYSSTNFEPIHIRFTNYPPYERLRIAINPQHPCIIQLDSLARASFAFHEKLESHHLLLEEATAHFTQPFVFLQCFMSLPASHARIEPGNLPFLPRSLQVRLTSLHSPHSCHVCTY